MSDQCCGKCMWWLRACLCTCPDMTQRDAEWVEADDGTDCPFFMTGYYNG